MRALLIVEAPADAGTTQTLVHRVLAQEVDWLRDYTRDDFDRLKLWHQENGRDWVTWTSLTDALEQRGVKMHYQSWMHGSGYEVKRNMALQLLAKLRADLTELEKPNALVMVVDQDNKDTRRTELEPARTLAADDLPVVVVGVPNKKREAWVLNALAAGAGRNRPEVLTLQKELKFHPLDEAHRLRGEADQNSAARDVKKVLELLCPTRPNDELEAIWTADLASLRARGTSSGLTDFLSSAEKLIPLLDPAAGSRS